MAVNMCALDKILHLDHVEFTIYLAIVVLCLISGPSNVR